MIQTPFPIPTPILIPGSRLCPSPNPYRLSSMYDPWKGLNHTTHIIQPFVIGASKSELDSMNFRCRWGKRGVHSYFAVQRPSSEPRIFPNMPSTATGTKFLKSHIHIYHLIKSRKQVRQAPGLLVRASTNLHPSTIVEEIYRNAFKDRYYLGFNDCQSFCHRVWQEICPPQARDILLP